MQKWEYCRIYFKASIVDEATKNAIEHDEPGVYNFSTQGEKILVTNILLKVMKLDEKETAINLKSLSEALETLGNEGWELVSHTEIHEPTCMQVFYFKRPIKE